MTRYVEPHCFKNVGIRAAVGLVEKLRGFLMTAPTSDLLVFASCSDVHTVGMSCRLDVAFANRRGIVMAAYRNVAPGCRIRCPGAEYVVEGFSSCRTEWFCEGDDIVAAVGKKKWEAAGLPCL